jgi:hypothetical protein
VGADIRSRGSVHFDDDELKLNEQRRLPPNNLVVEVALASALATTM